MKLFLRNIKKGFATNSSSYHSTVIFTKEEYERWKNEDSTEVFDVPYKYISNEDAWNEGKVEMYTYIESQTTREIDGKEYIAICFCETSEY